MLGIAIAVAVLIIVLSVVNGFERELKDRLLLMSAHASIEDPQGSLSDWQKRIADARTNLAVKAVSPYVEGQALIVYGGYLSGIELRGIDPVLENDVSSVSSVITKGSLLSLKEQSFGIVLGTELADILHVDIGDKVSII